MTQMTLEDVQHVLYDILIDIHEFCIKNNIQYSLAGGTLLGAIRHNGFIPWDNDLDVQMSRPEYERFIHSYKSEKGYQLFSPELESCEDVCIGFSRVCEMKRTYVDPGICPWTKKETGLWVDIMPIDGAPDNEKDARKKIKKMTLYWRILVMSRGRLKIKYSKANGFYMKMRLFGKKCLSRLVPVGFGKTYARMCQEYEFEKSSYLSNYATMKNGFREWQPKSSMDSFVLHKFEKGDFYIMEDYLTSLTSLYGDYMKYPPKEEQVPDDMNTFYWR